MHIPKKTIYSGVIFIFLLVSALGVGYNYGITRQMQEIESLRSEKQASEEGYAKGLTTVRNERDQTLNKYQTACLEYQKLRTSYDALYDKMGMGSGFDRYQSPDDARGNEESCYR